MKKNNEIVSSLFLKKWDTVSKLDSGMGGDQSKKNKKEEIQSVIAISYHSLPEEMISKANFVAQEASHSWGFLFVV